MKIIFKIIEYLPETEQIIVKFCRENSPKPIDEYNAGAVGTGSIDNSDPTSFVESLCKLGKQKVYKQEREETTLKENVCQDNISSVNIEDYVGGVYGIDDIHLSDDNVKSKRLKRIEIE